MFDGDQIGPEIWGPSPKKFSGPKALKYRCEFR